MKVEIQPGCDDTSVVIRCPEVTADVEALAAKLRADDNRLPGVRDGVTHLIAPDDVLYFESVDKRTFIYTTGAVYETPLRLYEIEQRLGPGFFRSSKAQIVNIAQIVWLCPDFGGRLEVGLPNDERLIISRHYAKQLKERLVAR